MNYDPGDESLGYSHSSANADLIDALPHGRATAPYGVLVSAMFLTGGGFFFTYLSYHAKYRS